VYIHISIHTYMHIYIVYAYVHCTCLRTFISFFFIFSVYKSRAESKARRIQMSLQFSRIRLNLVIFHKALLSSYIIISEILLSSLFFSSFSKSCDGYFFLRQIASSAISRHRRGRMDTENKCYFRQLGKVTDCV